jgi:hypothetical protein
MNMIAGGPHCGVYVMDAMEKRRMSCTCLESNPSRPTCSLVAIPTELSWFILCIYRQIVNASSEPKREVENLYVLCISIIIFLCDACMSMKSVSVGLSDTKGTSRVHVLHF